MVDPTLEAGMRAFGATDTDVELARKERGSSTEQVAVEAVFEVCPENWDVWLFFMRAQTQWNYVAGALGPAVRTGMNYAGVEAVARIRGVAAEQLQAWADDLHLIELAVLAADRELALKRKRNKRA